MTIPTKQDFAIEVRIDRLKLLWRATLVISILVGWIMLNVALLHRTTPSPVFISTIIFIIGALLTRTILSRGAYIQASWAFILASLAGLGVALLFADTRLFQVLPFAFPVLIFIVGLLVQPSRTVGVALIASAIIFVAPLLGQQNFPMLPVLQLASITLTLVSAVVAAQVAGDLYQIADWALSNYQRERRVSGELFESQMALETSLARSNALGERLQEANKELEDARAAAEEAKHFRGQFLANMSHELRTPLNAIIGFSETMLKYPVMYDGVKLPTAYEADLQQIYTSGRQLLTLINDILDLAKVDAGKLEVRMARVELQPLIKSVVSTASGLIGGKQITLEHNLPDYLPPVWADEARVRQVLLNLYSNAAKFTDHGSICLNVIEIDDGVCISLTDTGVGIPEGSLEMVFEEFKQAQEGGRDPRSGAGLGLAISRQLLTLMGGRIWVESEVGRGSTFYFTLQGFVDSVPETETELELLEVSN